MEIQNAPLDGVFVINTQSFEDRRGYFYEAYNRKKFEEAGLNINFVQDNVSKSVYGTIRGLHYQVGDFAQVKLCRVLVGKVLDIAVDIRFGSPTFGKHIAEELSEDNKKQLLIPEGFAHGFVVLSREAVFSYKVGNYYDKDSERTILFNDPTLNIDWKVPHPVISDKDRTGVKFLDIQNDFTYKK